jgi:hypothetical protein
MNDCVIENVTAAAITPIDISGATRLAGLALKGLHTSTAP